MLSASSRAQTGVTINFANTVGPVSGLILRAPIYGPEISDPTRQIHGQTSLGFPAGVTTYTGPLLSGTNYTAELWGGPEGTGATQLVPLARTTFRTGGAAGYLVSIPSVVVPFAQPGQRIPLELRVWNNYGDLIQSFAEAECACRDRGYSGVFISDPLGGTTGTETIDLRGLQSFCLYVSPAMPIDFLLSVGSSNSMVRSDYAFEGEDATITLKCVPAALAVQWSHAGTNLPAETNRSITLRNVSAEHAGRYQAAWPQFGVSNFTQLSVWPRPRLSEPRVTPLGGFAATLVGVTNRAMVLEISSDLSSWMPWKTQSFLGPASFTKEGPLGTSQFFRARPSP